LEITGGNAEGTENKGIAEKATRKVMQGKKLKIDGSRRPTEVRRVGDELGIGTCPVTALTRHVLAQKLLN